MSTKAKRHTHKYHRMNINGNMQWKCALPDCTHVMPRHLTDTIIGKYSICWNCGDNRMIMSDENMNRDEPICYNCSHGIKPEVTKEVDLADVLELMRKKRELDTTVEQSKEEDKPEVSEEIKEYLKKYNLDKLESTK